MKVATLQEIAGWVDGAIMRGVPSESVSAVSTDSRSLAGGELFVALKGERFDAHEFLADVGEKGAAAVIVSSLEKGFEGFDGAILHVRDSLAALQMLALHARRAYPDFRAIGVTGSNGKTSTKDFLRAVLECGGRVNATAGNLNNHIGLPLTILAGEEGDRFGVWEMGMNHPGEIEVLAEIAAPDAAVITQIGTAHIEHMETREAIAAEKSELALAIPESGYCAMPAGDDFFDYVTDRVRCEMVSAGLDEGMVQARGIEVDSSGRARFQLVSEFSGEVPVILPVRGRHMIQNALLAAAVGLKEGIAAGDVAAALGAVELTGGRLQERTVGGLTVLDDSYNANPDSMRAALRTLADAEVTGRRVAVLGFMGELGDHAEEQHLLLGKTVVETGIDLLVTVGEGASLIGEGAGGGVETHHFPSHDEASAFLLGVLRPGDLTLFKGSRAAGMEKVIAGLN